MQIDPDSTSTSLRPLLRATVRLVFVKEQLFNKVLALGIIQASLILLHSRPLDSRPLVAFPLPLLNRNFT